MFVCCLCAAQRAEGRTPYITQHPTSKKPDERSTKRPDSIKSTHNNSHNNETVETTMVSTFIIFTAVYIFHRGVYSFNLSPSLIPRAMTTLKSSRQVCSVDTAVSNRVQQTLDPCVVLMKQLIAKHQHLWVEEGIYSLAQGVVYWKPPPSAYESITDVIQDSENSLHEYTQDEGLPELQTALKEKLARENNLSGCDVIITSGANQAYMNCVLTLMSEGDLCVVFTPFYFNHYMAVQMTRGDEALLAGPIDDDGCPSIAWLKEKFESEEGNRIKMVTIVNPGNPTGVSIPTKKLQNIVEICQEYGAWVIFDATYEQFDHIGANTFPILNSDGSESGEYGFHCFNDERVITIFSFSKGYAMAGFRVGYVAMNTQSEMGKNTYEQMVKVQDTIPICTSQISQYAALGALKAGRGWVDKKVKTLDTGRQAILDALSPLETSIGGTGAMYVMGKLPEGEDDMVFSERLIEKFGIAVIPGSFCGFPGWIRVCYSNLPTKECLKAASRLKNGIKELCSKKYS